MDTQHLKKTKSLGGEFEIHIEDHFVENSNKK
jgi:hypothetical protein